MDSGEEVHIIGDGFGSKQRKSLQVPQEPGGDIPSWIMATSHAQFLHRARVLVNST